MSTKSTALVARGLRIRERDSRCDNPIRHLRKSRASGVAHSGRLWLRFRIVGWREALQCLALSGTALTPFVEHIVRAARSCWGRSRALAHFAAAYDAPVGGNRLQNGRPRLSINGHGRKVPAEALPRMPCPAPCPSRETVEASSGSCPGSR